jgi:hypothetical protein
MYEFRDCSHELCTHGSEPVSEPYSGVQNEGESAATRISCDRFPVSVCLSLSASLIIIIITRVDVKKRCDAAQLSSSDLCRDVVTSSWVKIVCVTP